MSDVYDRQRCNMKNQFVKRKERSTPYLYLTRERTHYTYFVFVPGAAHSSVTA